MKRTYTGTMMRPDLRTAEIEIEAYDTCKYYGKAHGVSVTYNGITAWDIIEGGKEAEEIEKDTDCIDDFHEYLVLHLLNGETATFRNSYVDMWIF